MFKLLQANSAANVRLALNLAGMLILLVGLASAVIILRAHAGEQQTSDEQIINPEAPLTPSDSRKQSREIEIYYGKTGLLFERWSEQAAALFHGKALAKVIAIGSGIMASGCFLAARRVPKSSKQPAVEEEVV
jgi:hypothetical protein